MDGLGNVLSFGHECDVIFTEVVIFGVAWFVAAEFAAEMRKKGRQTGNDRERVPGAKPDALTN